MKETFSPSVAEPKAAVKMESATLQTIPVTVQNFERAETDMYFSVAMA